MAWQADVLAFDLSVDILVLHEFCVGVKGDAVRLHHHEVVPSVQHNLPLLASITPEPLHCFDCLDILRRGGGDVVQLLKPSLGHHQGDEYLTTLGLRRLHRKVDTSKSGELCHSLDVAMWMSESSRRTMGAACSWCWPMARDMADLTSHLGRVISRTSQEMIGVREAMTNSAWADSSSLAQMTLS